MPRNTSYYHTCDLFGSKLNKNDFNTTERSVELKMKSRDEMALDLALLCTVADLCAEQEEPEASVATATLATSRRDRYQAATFAMSGQFFPK